MNGMIIKNCLPTLGLINAAVQWFKPHVFVNHRTSKSLILFLCRNFKLILPTMILSSFWIFDWNESEYGFYELTLSRRVQFLIRIMYNPEVVENDEDNEELGYYYDDEYDTINDDDESEEDTVSVCSYMDDFNPDIEVINYYVLSPDFFGCHTESN